LRSTRRRISRGVPRLRAPLQRSFLQELARREVGACRRATRRYARRSPINYARAIAFAVPLQMFWSLADEVVLDQAHNSAFLFQRIS
jgi:hypothetical protein